MLRKSLPLNLHDNKKLKIEKNKKGETFVSPFLPQIYHKT